ncbi:unnamed protein product [Merluccius merluccius]
MLPLCPPDPGCVRLAPGGLRSRPVGSRCRLDPGQPVLRSPPCRCRPDLLLQPDLLLHHISLIFRQRLSSPS